MDEFQITVEETKKKLDAGKIVLIDVREEWENKLTKIDGSLLIPLRQLPGKINEIKKIAKGKEIVAYCHHGNRSAFAAELLRRNGIKNARTMSGGIEDWSRKIDNKIARY